MSELSPEARALIAKASGLDDPSPDDRARVRDELMQKLGAGAFAAAAVCVVSTSAVASSSAGTGATTSLTTGAAVAKGGASALGLGKLLIAAGVVTAASTALVVTTHPPAATPARAPHVLAPASVAGTAQELGAELEPPPPAPTQATTKPSAEPARTAPAPSRARARIREEPPQPPPEAQGGVSLKDELESLGRAQRALSDGRAADALRMAEQHLHRFPSGSMRAEAFAVEALARCALGEDAAAVASRFAKQAPDSLLKARVDAACGSNQE
jgi:hypothetical protein